MDPSNDPLGGTVTNRVPVGQYPATCADCGSACTVPFQPKDDRPVYCFGCLPKHRRPGFIKPDDDPLVRLAKGRLRARLRGLHDHAPTPAEALEVVDLMRVALPHWFASPEPAPPDIPEGALKNPDPPQRKVSSLPTSALVSQAMERRLGLLARRCREFAHDRLHANLDRILDRPPTSEEVRDVVALSALAWPNYLAAGRVVRFFAQVMGVPIEAPQVDETTAAIEKAIVALVRKGPAPQPFWTLTRLEKATRSDCDLLPGSPRDRVAALAALLFDGVLQRRALPPSEGATLEVWLDEGKAHQLGLLGDSPAATPEPRAAGAQPLVEVAPGPAATSGPGSQPPSAEPAQAKAVPPPKKGRKGKGARPELAPDEEREYDGPAVF